MNMTRRKRPFTEITNSSGKLSQIPSSDTTSTANNSPTQPRVILDEHDVIVLSSDSEEDSDSETFTESNTTSRPTTLPAKRSNILPTTDQPNNTNMLSSNLHTAIAAIKGLSAIVNLSLTPNAAPQSSIKEPACNQLPNSPLKKTSDFSETECPGPVTDDGIEEVYEVERILTSYRANNGQEKYLIKWKGWAYKDSTWEDKSSLDCPEVLDTYKLRMKVCGIIKQKCDKEERKNYPYNPIVSTRISFFLKLGIFEDKINKVCRKAGIAPIYVENWYDDECAPENFDFIQESIIHQSAKKLFRPETVNIYCRDCNSEAYCRRGECCASKAGSGFPYTCSKLTVREGSRIIECGALCKCDRNCPSRLLQRGRQFPVVLFRTQTRGWSIRAATFIPRGSFVMQYMGEVISKEEADRREFTSFMYDVDTPNVDEHTFTVDAIRVGNEARWVNHSCDPNLKTYGVLASRCDARYEQLGFFAIKDIKVGEEMTIDYYVHIKGELLVDGAECHCKSKNCRGFLMD